MKRIPFTDLSYLTNEVKDAYLGEVKKILEANQFILSEEVSKFEEEFAKVIGAKFCIGVSSGADALYLAFLALGIKEGDEVITQGNAYNASVTAALRVGAIVRFADVSNDTLTLKAENIKPLINKKTKAILPVHLYGQANDMEAIMKVAKENSLFVIEDCAQSHLATYKGRNTGTFGDIGAFSFFPTKNLGAFGDAGAIVTDNAELAAIARIVRNLGQKTKNEHTHLGYNLRLDPMQAVALRLKLPLLRKNTELREKSAAIYNELLKPLKGKVEPISVSPSSASVYHLYVVRLNSINRDAVQQKLAKLGVDTAIHYPSVVYKQPFYKGATDSCPVAEKASQEILSLPFFVGITREQQEFVVNALKEAIVN